MTQPAKGQEPSMEEILASIRRIIADEEPAKGTTEDTSESRQESPAPRARERRPAAPHRATADHLAAVASLSRGRRGARAAEDGRGDRCDAGSPQGRTAPSARRERGAGAERGSARTGRPRDAASRN